MSNLFRDNASTTSNEPREADVPEGSSPFGAGGGGARGGPADQGVVRNDTAGKALKGAPRPVVYPQKYGYDYVRGRGKNLPFRVTRDDRMSMEDAAAKLHEIHEKMEIADETEDILYAFDSALWFCHTVNGGSTLVPGRSEFSVPGVTCTFNYSTIRDLLGTDMRRFFRAYADDISEVNKRVLRDYDQRDYGKMEQWGWLQDVAHARGLQRYPHLAHDSADACLNLSATERQALRASKTLVIGATPNSADRMRPNGGIASADTYDSSVGERY